MSVVIALTMIVVSIGPTIPCRFHEANALVHRWEGACGQAVGDSLKITLKPEKVITSGRWRRDVDPVAAWTGQEMISGGRSPIELEVYGGGTGALRTESGWYPVSGFRSKPAQMSFEIDTTRTVPPSELDREIIRRADALLSSEAVWNRHDDRQCPASATTWSIYCAMQRATIVTTCGAHHRRPAMELVREIIEARTVGRAYEHRLMDYNNDSTTTLSDVRSLFREALSRVGGRDDQPLGAPPVCPPPPPEPTIGVADLRIAERAGVLLSSANAWDRHGTQDCPATQKTLTIYCALERATEEVTGEIEAPGPLMREARSIVDSLAPNKYRARLVDFNNDPATSFAQVQTFFRILRERIAGRRSAPK